MSDDEDSTSTGDFSSGFAYSVSHDLCSGFCEAGCLVCLPDMRIGDILGQESPCQRSNECVRVEVEMEVEVLESQCSNVNIEILIIIIMPSLNVWGALPYDTPRWIALDILPDILPFGNTLV